MTESERGTPDSEPPGSAGSPGPPPRPPGPVPAGYVPREWLQQGGLATSPTVAVAVPPPPSPPSSPESLLPPPPASALIDRPFLDTPWVPPQTKRQGWMWLVYAVVGFVIGQLGAVVFGLVAGIIAGKNASQLKTIASAPVPPEWYVVASLLGIWIGFVGAPWMASRTQGTRRFVRDLGLRFRLIDLVGIGIGIGGQIVVALMYAPFIRHIHDFNGPSQKLTGASHGGGFVVIALATVLLAPFMEELFFRGLLLKALVRLLTPLRAAGTARTVTVVAAVVLDGLLFGLAHGEWIQLAGLAVFGTALAAIAYRTGRLGMNMVAHATFNLVAIIAIASNSNALIH